MITTTATLATMPCLPEWLTNRVKIPTESSMAYLARHSHSFRYAARFIPAPHDELIADVYAFCRFTDDIVDGDARTPSSEMRARLSDWQRLAGQAYAGIPTGIKLLDKPLGEMGRRGIPFAYAVDLIEGMRMDVREKAGGEAAPSAPGRRYANLAALDVYGYRVASVVGLWLTRLVGVHDEEVLARAAELGQAMQLTNILRDVGEDWRNGRLYLPLDVLERHGITEEDIARAAASSPEAPRIPRGWDVAMEELMRHAEGRYERAFEAIPALPAFFRSPVAVSGMVYRDIHTAIRRNGYDNFTRRAHTSASRKVWLGAKARLWLARAPRAARASVAPGLVTAGSPRDKTGNVAARARAAHPLAGLVTGAALILPALGGAGATAAGIPDIGPIAAVARAEKAVADSALRAAPGDAGLHLRKLRALHTLSVADESALAAARRALSTAERATSGRPETASVWLAYRGAFDIVEARHAVWPPARLKALRRGLDRLDEAVRRAPDDVDVRYLRLTSTYYLPAFFGRGESVTTDFKVLADLLPAVSGVYPSGWYGPLADFVLKNAPLTADERDRLRQVRAQATAAPSG